MLRSGSIDAMDNEKPHEEEPAYQIVGITEEFIGPSLIITGANPPENDSLTFTLCRWVVGRKSPRL